jgi:hypothetical protein
MTRSVADLQFVQVTDGRTKWAEVRDRQTAEVLFTVYDNENSEYVATELARVTPEE